MMPNAASCPSTVTTATLVSGSRTAFSTRLGRQFHGRPGSIRSRDIAAMSSASSGWASRTGGSMVMAAGAAGSRRGWLPLFMLSAVPVGQPLLSTRTRCAPRGVPPNPLGNFTHSARQPRPVLATPHERESPDESRRAAHEHAIRCLACAVLLRWPMGSAAMPTTKPLRCHARVAACLPLRCVHKSLFGLAMFAPAVAMAHVKWFATWNAGEPPLGLGHLCGSPAFAVLFAFAYMVVLMAQAIDRRLTGVSVLSGWKARAHRATAPRAAHVLRL